MEGGIEYLRDVIVNDRLGIAEELEKQMQFCVDTYQCEWKAVVEDPEKRRLFEQFVNTPDSEPTIEFVKEAEQPRPAAWRSDPLRAAGRADPTPRQQPGAALAAGRQGVGLPRRGRFGRQVRSDADRRLQFRQPR